MKTIRYIFSIVTVWVIGLLTITSCTDKNDWSVDSSYDRVFSPKASSISVDKGDTYATVTFNSAPRAEYYIIEISTDELNDDIPMGGTDHSQVFGLDKSITLTSYLIEDLIGDTQYYLRIKGMSDKASDSHWAYYNDGLPFKTLAEQIMNAVTSDDRSEDWIRVTWDADKSVTTLVVTDGNGDEVPGSPFDVSNAGGEYTVTGLASSTTYTFSIYYGETKRGEITATTNASMPDADYVKILTADETIISQDLLNEFAERAAADGKTNYGVTIGIPADAVVDFRGSSDTGSSSNVTLPDGMSITFFGRAGGDAPTIKFQNLFNLAGSHAYVTFQNVKLVDDGAGYLVNQGDACTVSEFNIIDSEVSGFATSFFRMQGNAAKSFGTVKLTNSIFHDMCSGYSFLHIDANKGLGGGVKNILIDGCTLYNIAKSGKMFIYSRETAMENIIVSNTTFYNCIGGGQYWIDFGNTTTGCSGKLEFTGCLFTKTPDETTNKNIRSSNSVITDECYHTTDFFKKLGSTALTYGSDELFTDPANGDFSLTKELKAGDPRWFAAE